MTMNYGIAYETQIKANKNNKAKLTFQNVHLTMVERIDPKYVATELVLSFLGQTYPWQQIRRPPVA